MRRMGFRCVGQAALARRIGIELNGKNGSSTAQVGGKGRETDAERGISRER